MSEKAKNTEVMIIIKDKETGRELKFRRNNKSSITLLNPDTNDDHLTISVSEDGEVTHVFDGIEPKSPSDAMKCLLWCSKECNGDLLCLAGCAAECSTIIFP